MPQMSVFRFWSRGQVNKIAVIVKMYKIPFLLNRGTVFHKKNVAKCLSINLLERFPFTLILKGSFENIHVECLLRYIQSHNRVCLSKFRSEISYPTSATKIPCPCICDPLTPHFYIVNMELTGVYIIFLFLL